jgi:hypothetical protein
VGARADAGDNSHLRVIIVWIYARGGQSLALAILFHHDQHILPPIPEPGSRYNPLVIAAILAMIVSVIAAIDSVWDSKHITGVTKRMSSRAWCAKLKVTLPSEVQQTVAPGPPCLYPAFAFVPFRRVHTFCFPRPARFYLPRSWIWRRLLTVLSLEEVTRPINEAGTLFQPTLLMTLYGTGMRRSVLAHPQSGPRVATGTAPGAAKA